MNKKYLTIHQRIANDKSRMRQWMNEPFFAYGKTMSTNGYVLVVTPDIGSTIDYSDKVRNVYPLTILFDKTFTLTELKEKLATVPLIDCYDTIKKRCDACDGDGVVNFTFEYGYKEYELENDCPVCDGEGLISYKSDEPSGKKQLDYGNIFKIYDSSFALQRIEELIFICDTLGEEIIHHCNRTPNLTNLFIIGNVEVYLKETVREHNIAATIQN